MLSNIIFGAVGGLLVFEFLKYRKDHKNETLSKALKGFVMYWVNKIIKLIKGAK